MEPSDETPWFAGVLCAALTAVLVGAAITSMGVAMSAVSSVFAVIVVGVVVAGSAPTVLRYRRRPVWRWLVPGAGVGAALGCIVVVASVL